MIGYLKGNVLNISGNTAIIEVNGIGYEVYCSSGALYRISGKQVGDVWTYMAVKDDGVYLYGFESIEEKNMFLKLISVSGVGPKMGIMVLSAMNLHDLAFAIASSDVKMLSSVKGLGKKTAERLILELRENISSLDLPAEPKSKKVSTKTADALPKEDEDAIIALMTLGYRREESKQAVEKAKEEGAVTLEEIITLALRGF